MSSRNPMNERYTTERKGGKSRKSAASVKPKKSVASGVVTGTKKKNKAAKTTKREQKRKVRDKEYEAERRYGDPPTKSFKKLRKLWIIFLILSIVFVGLSFASSKLGNLPEWVAMFFLGAAYFSIIVTLYIDLGKIRRARREYAAKMMAAQGKEVRAQQKKLKAELRKKEKEELEKQKDSKDKTPETVSEKIKDKLQQINPFKKQ